MKTQKLVLEMTICLVISWVLISAPAFSQEGGAAIKSVTHPVTDELKAYFSDVIVSVERKRGEYRMILHADGTWESSWSGKEGKKEMEWWVLRTGKLCKRYGPYYTRRGKPRTGGHTRCWEVEIIDDTEFDLTSPLQRGSTWERKKK